MLEDEDFKTYFLQITKISKYGKLDERSIRKYILNGIEGYMSSKIIMYSAKTYKELEYQYNIFKIVQECQIKKGSYFKKEKPFKKCLNCGAGGQMRDDEVRHKEM